MVVAIRLAKYLLVITSLMLITSAAISAYDLRGEFMEVYEGLVEVSELGIDVGPLISKLSTALDLINDGDPQSLTKAESLINEVRSELQVIRSRAGYVVLYLSLSKYLIIASLALMPIAIYYVLPRAYLMIWFKVRRGWVVRHGRT